MTWAARIHRILNPVCEHTGDFVGTLMRDTFEDNTINLCHISTVFHFTGPF